jgi:tRNA G37 N-methylase TrmD
VPPILVEPFDESFTKETAKDPAYSSADQDGVTSEKRRFVKDEYARAQAKATAYQRPKERSGNDIPQMISIVRHRRVSGIREVSVSGIR